MIRRVTLAIAALVLVAAAGDGRTQTLAPATEIGVASCLLVPSLDVNIGTPVDGVLEDVQADRGDIVQQGQVLARLNVGVESAAVEHAAAKVKFAERKRQRNENLQRRDLISQQEADEIETDLELSRLELRERREHLRLRSMLAPFSGVIVDRFRAKGDLVRQEKIYRLAQLDPLFAEVVMRADAFGRVRTGAGAEIDLPMLRRKVPARVTVIDRVIDPASGTFRVRLSIANPRNEIPSGLRCQVSFLPPPS